VTCTFDGSAERIRQAARFLPGGVSSNFRLGMSPTPLVFDHADGPFLHDVDGNRLIDYYLGMGPMILGHRPEAVVEAVRAQLERGILFGGQSEVEFEAAELVCAMLPSAEKVRFSSSGSEAAQAALRLARAATGRGVIVKFEGHYHGWLDNVLWSVAPAADAMGAEGAPVPQPGTTGQDAHAGQLVEVLSWNRPDFLEERLSRGDVAAVIMEPAMCNTGAIFPAPGYLEAVRDICTRTGTVLIFDEVITGFRVGPGGAQGRLGVTPDLTLFGKAVASGFPEIFHVGFGLTAPPRNYRDILATDRAGYVRLTTALLARGVRVLERGAWFISTRHDDAVVDETVAALKDALASL